jgi:hypothetical protein
MTFASKLMTSTDFSILITFPARLLLILLFLPFSALDCLSHQGELLGKLFVAHRVANLKFGGLRRDRLFIGASQSLYAIFLNRRGLPFP